jgi:hypothetical protein
MTRRRHKIFVSHGWADRWVAQQIALRLTRDCGCATFLDAFNVEKGDDIETKIFAELDSCHELVMLLTPWAADRNWLWVEAGAARMKNIRIVAVLYGLTLSDLDKEKGGKTFLGAKNIVDINELESYFVEVCKRAAR